VFQFLDRKRSEGKPFYFDLGFGHNRENIAVKMHGAALVFGVREYLAHGLQHSHSLVADNELYLFCASIAVIRPMRRRQYYPSTISQLSNIRDNR